VVHLLTYLAGLPHHGSPLLFPMYPQLIHPPEMHRYRCRGPHPSLEGRGQVAASLVWRDLRRKKGVSRCMVRGL